MKKIMDSEIDLFSRIGIFITMCAVVVLINPFFVSNAYNPNLPYWFQLCLSFIFGFIGIIVLLIGLVFIGLFAGAIEWIFTGEFWGTATEAIGNIINTGLVFVFKFLYGNWWRAK